MNENDLNASSTYVDVANNEKTAKPEPSISVMLMAGIGGMLAFFGLSFGLVAAVAEPGFLIVCLITCAIALSLFVIAYLARRNQLVQWKKAEEKAISLAKCNYCGSQNTLGSKKCESCGAPL